MIGCGICFCIKFSPCNDTQSFRHITFQGTLNDHAGRLTMIPKQKPENSLQAPVFFFFLLIKENYNHLLL